METFRFAHPEYLYLLLVVPVLIIGMIISQISKRKALAKFGRMETIAELMPFRSKRRPILKNILLISALLSLIIGLAQPQFGSKLQTIKREGIELIIALDVSNSMLSEDISPNRLDRAKMAISKVIDNLDSDKIGLIIFAGDAYTQLPLTTDYPSAKLFLKSISTNIIPVQGTAIGSAISLATNSFSPTYTGSKALIIMTDGENHEDNAVDAAKYAQSQGITIHTVGMGLPKGAPIPTIDKRGNKTFLKDRDGNTVITKLNESMLSELAATGGGIYIRASNAQIGLKKILNEIDKMDKSEMEDNIYTAYKDQYHYFFWLALLLFLFDFIILERKNRHLIKLNIFEKQTK